MTDPAIFYSKVAIAFFLLANTIVMLNLLIAVMLEDYSSLSSSSRTLYLRWLIQIHPLWKGDPRNGFLSYKFGPFALLNLLLSPCLFLSKSRRFNLCLEIFHYLIPLLFTALVFCLLDVVYFFLCVLLLLSRTFKLRHEPSQSAFSLKFARSKQRRLLRSLICSCPCRLLSNLSHFCNQSFHS